MRFGKPEIMALALAVSAGAASARAEDPIQQVSALVESGHLNMDVSLHAGGIALPGGRRLATVGAPVLRLGIDAVDGHLTRLSGRSSGGTIVLESPGLIPTVVIDSVEVDATGTITSARFRGRSFFGKLLVPLFKGKALKAVRRLKFNTAIVDLVQGRLVDAGPAAATPALRPGEGTPPEASKEPSATELVDEICFEDSFLKAFPGKKLSLGGNFQITTDEDPATNELVTVNIASMRWRPARGETPSDLVATGSLDGRVKDGKVLFQRGQLAFRGGTVTDARFLAFTQPEGISSRVMGERLHLDLARGDIHVPGGVAVALEGGALDLSKFVTDPSGELTGHVAFALRGATGTIHREGESLTLSNVVVRSPGLTVDRNRATGPLDVDFTYRLVRPFAVNYPVPELAARTVSLTFQGPMALRLALDDVGAGDEGVVSGTYAFEVPWAPIERAAFEVARARWTQDVAVVVKQVSFEVDPQEFRPCGESCFGAKFRLLAQKLSAKGKALISEKCSPEFQAAIVVDKKARSFVLKGLQVRPHCEGAGGWVVNFLAPFFTKSYEDMTLFKMPPGLPFTIETVKATDATMKIAGAVQWVAGPN
ncbi:MAG: hypothetical protein ACHQJD_00035 [Thermoanaerobaculia bacterium]